jgi:hypothetical protein
LEKTMSDLSHDARELLEVARHEDGPTPAERERLRRAVFGAVAGGSTVLGSAGAAGAVGASAGAGTGAKLSLVAGMSAKMSTAPLAIWFAVGTAAGLATVAPVAAVRYATSSPTQGVKSSAPADASKLEPRKPAPPSHEPLAPLAEPAPPTRPEAVTRPSPTLAPAPVNDSLGARATVSAPNALGLEPPPLTMELDLLGTAQRELAAGRAEQALTWLGEHERRFPSGALRGERLAARVFALCALGRADEARRVTREFERVAPGSPLTPRVLASCGGEAGGAPSPKP